MVMRILGPVSVATCWVVTGLRISWCGLAHELDWQAAAILDRLFARWESDHCRSCAEWYRR